MTTPHDNRAIQLGPTGHAMIAAGVDIGGTKIEVQIFDDSWAQVARHRCATPQGYPALVAAVAEQIAWAHNRAQTRLPVGIATAGLLNPATGLALAANLAANGQPFAADIAKAAGHPVAYLNDARAMALSEAAFGAGQGHRRVLSLVLGTGVGGGMAIDGALQRGPTGTGGEFGHTSAGAHLVEAHGLPVYRCGCGRMGCIETYIAGPGLTRLARHVTGLDLPPEQIATRRAGDMAQVWGIWTALTADLIHTLTLTTDPDIIVLGGGLSQIDGVTDTLMAASKAAQIGDFAVPPIVRAQGGDASGARGAAFAAWKGPQDG